MGGSGEVGVGDLRREDLRWSGWDGMGEMRGGVGEICAGGGCGGDSSCEESLFAGVKGLCVGNWVARALPLKSFEPLERKRERERRWVGAVRAGSGSGSGSWSGSCSGSGSS